MLVLALCLVIYVISSDDRLVARPSAVSLAVRIGIDQRDKKAAGVIHQWQPIIYSRSGIR